MKEITTRTLELDFATVGAQVLASFYSKEKDMSHDFRNLSDAELVRTAEASDGHMRNPMVRELAYRLSRHVKPILEPAERDKDNNAPGKRTGLLFDRGGS